MSPGQFLGGPGDGSSNYWGSGIRLDGLFTEVTFNGGPGEGSEMNCFIGVLDFSQNLNFIYHGGMNDGFDYALLSCYLSFSNTDWVFRGESGDGFNYSQSSHLLSLSDISLMYNGGYADGFSNGLFQGFIDLSIEELYTGGPGDGFDHFNYGGYLDIATNTLFAGGEADGFDVQTQTLKFPVCHCSPMDKIYVNKLNPGTNNGSSWQHAFYSLPFALDHAALCNKETIWIAQGTYFPTTGNNRYISFRPPQDVSIFGGFIGNEMNLNTRNWVVNQTILSGDIGIQNSIVDNSIHVIDFSSLEGWSLLDGFYIEYGNADGFTTGPINKGGGIYNNNPLYNQQITIANSVIKNNFAALSGSGLYQTGLMANIILQNVQIISNTDPLNIQVLNKNLASMTLIGEVQIKE